MNVMVSKTSASGGSSILQDGTVKVSNQILKVGVLLLNSVLSKMQLKYTCK